MEHGEAAHVPHERRAKNPEKLSKSERVSYRVFREQAKGWYIEPDTTADYCPKHWNAVLEKVGKVSEKEDLDLYVSEAVPVGQKSLHSRYWNSVVDSWVVHCDAEEEDGSFCKESIQVSLDASGTEDE